MEKGNDHMVREYRDFTMTNSFRKMAEEIIGPFIKMYLFFKVD